MYQYAQLLNDVYTNYKVKYLFVLNKIVSIFALTKLINVLATQRYE